MGDSINKSDSGGRKKGEEVAAKSEANQIRAKLGEKAAGNNLIAVIFSGGASASALHSSRRRSAIVQSVVSPPASRVSTMPALMLTAGSRA